MPRAVILRSHFVPLAVLSVAVVFHLGRIKSFTPLLLYSALVVASTPIAYNRGQAWPDAKLLIMTVATMVVTLTFIRRPSHARFIILLFLLYRYAWFGLHGVAFGRVPWDPLIANADQFGSIMAMGLASAGAIALGATDTRLRRVASALAMLCVAGLVSSFARGAFLVGGMSLLFLWYRAEGRRWANAALIALAVIATAVAGSVYTNVSAARGRDNSSSWWTEMSSVTSDIADEDAEDRRLIWRIGWRVFTEHPVIGVGSGNWGVYAAGNYSGDFLGERFSRNPDRLWGRAMHNAFMQQLAEHGLVGFTLFMWMLLDIQRRNMVIRRHTARDDTSLFPGLRTVMVVTAFEGCMVALLGAGMFYNVVNFWFFALIIANALFYQVWLSNRQALLSNAAK